MNDITLNWKKINHFIGEKARTIRDRAYTKEEIRRMLDNLNKMLDSFMEEEKMIRREREKEEMTTIKCSAGKRWRLMAEIK
jgi:hypothetical protein